jgi:peptidoglycan/xylan/chitin deacetylase (PgdA/CDA1 family)
VPPLHKLAGLLIICAVVAGVMLPSARHSTHTVRRTAARVTVRPPEPVPPTAPAAAVRAKANELGEVPVLMYHRIMAKPQSALDRTPQQLRTELVRLATEGYVPVTAAEYVRGRMDVPAGRHPVVLTFDDGSPGQFGLDARGDPVADSAVAVITDVARRYPGFRAVATFFVNKDPFTLTGGQAAIGVRWLVQHGFEVANHTVHHSDLAGMAKTAVQKEIGDQQKAITGLGAPAPVTFAYPYGALSHLSWAQTGPGWSFRGMFLAGWKPADSPFEKDFDARLIPRIRSEDKVKQDGCDKFCSVAWLDWLAKNPDKRYTSDGDSRVISFPAAKAVALASRFRALGRPY